MKSPVAFGFHTSESLVRLMAAIRTSFVTSSPSDERSVTEVMIVPRQRAVDRKRNAHGLAGDAEGGHVQAQELDVGQPRAAADRHREDRHPAHPQPGGGLHRRRALVPVAVGGQHDASQVGDLFGGARPAARSGRCRGPAAGSAIGWSTTFIRSRRRVPRRRIGQRRDRLAPAWPACAVGWSAATTSRVSMLVDASQSTAIAGFSSGRNSSIHSG